MAYPFLGAFHTSGDKRSTSVLLLGKIDGTALCLIDEDPVPTIRQALDKDQSHGK